MRTNKWEYIYLFPFRCINGSTLLHTACYYGHLPAIRELLSLRVDVNVRDYKGATPLHRAKDPDVMEVGICAWVFTCVLCINYDVSDVFSEH